MFSQWLDNLDGKKGARIGGEASGEGGNVEGRKGQKERENGSRRTSSEAGGNGSRLCCSLLANC